MAGSAVFGYGESPMALTLDQWNKMPATEASQTILACCGSARWAKEIVGLRPFADLSALENIAFATWNTLDESDWLEAFSHHPRIGDINSSKPSNEKVVLSAAWARDEQNGSTTASNATLLELAAGNRAYEDKFHHVFLICATGKSAEEMLTALRMRIANDPATELRNAMAEQAKITQLRLRKLFSNDDRQ